MFTLPLTLAALAASSHAQITGTFPATPLASMTGFTYPSGIPEKVDPSTQLARGPQFGYNLCNSTTEGPNALCQTLIANSLPDFCLWGPSVPNSTVADQEGEMVSWCTKKGYGSRIIPAGALQGVQFRRTPDYMVWNGFIDQTLLNLQADDFGGEMDPHGQDLRGNPIGGLAFSNGFSNGSNFEQVVEWNNFIGGGSFCLKMCNPAGPNAAAWCRNTLDRIGCTYNAPNNAQNGTFETCDSDSGEFPGVYTTNGAVVTYSQPPEELGPITSIPYTPVIPASSNCVPVSSAAIYTELPSPTLAPSSSPTGAAATSGRNGATSGGSSATRSGSAAGASSTSGTSGAETLAISSVSILGVVFASLFLA